MGSTLPRKQITGHDPACERPSWSSVEAGSCSQCAQIAVIRERLSAHITLEAHRHGIAPDETVRLEWVVAVLMGQHDPQMGPGLAGVTVVHT